MTNSIRAAKSMAVLPPNTPTPDHQHTNDNARSVSESDSTSPLFLSNFFSNQEEYHLEEGGLLHSQVIEIYIIKSDNSRIPGISTGCI